MAYINDNFLNLSENYLFSEISKRKSEFLKKYPDKNIISLGIGDVTLPLPNSCIKAMKDAVIELSYKNSFRGYGPEQGYGFLREKISQSYIELGVDISVEEIFVGDGAKSDIANITDLFSSKNKVLVTSPVYPVYVDTNLINGRLIEYVLGSEKNNFLPLPNKNSKADIIYICSPNNPTGAVYTKEMLKIWVDFAIAKGAIILFDSAYSSYISDDTLPRSIYEIDGSKQCAIEFCSFSKTAGFTGVRCGYTVIPDDIIVDKVQLNKLWLRRQTTKFNGVSYITQRGAEAIYSEQGKKETKDMINYYMENAKLISDFLKDNNIYHTGGINAPYIWMKCPNKLKSWEFFDVLLNEINIIGTPGVGFGENGDNYLRLTAFGTNEDTKEAINRLNKYYN